MNPSAHKLHGHPRWGFTLIEMLVVIAIIAILAALITPTIGSAMQRARKARVQAELQGIKTAIQAYMNDYAKLPITTGHGSADTQYDGDDSKTIFKVLTANESGGAIANTRKIVYLETTALSTDGTFKDAWGTQYSIKLDNNYDNKIDGYSTVAIAMSAGPDMKIASTNDNLSTVQQ